MRCSRPSRPRTRSCSSRVERMGLVQGAQLLSAFLQVRTAYARALVSACCVRPAQQTHAAGDVLWTANAGDSRAVLIRRDKHPAAVRLTEDHKPDLPLERRVRLLFAGPDSGTCPELGHGCKSCMSWRHAVAQEACGGSWRQRRARLLLEGRLSPPGVQQRPGCLPRPWRSGLQGAQEVRRIVQAIWACYVTSLDLSGHHAQAGHWRARH